MLAGTLAFVLGVWWSHRLPLHPDPWWSIPLAAAVLLGASGRARWPLFALLLGLAWAAWDHGTTKPLPPQLAGIDLQVEGVVQGLPESTPRRDRFLLRIDELPSGQRDALVRLSWYGQRPAVAPGQRLELEVRLREPRGFANPGAFDYSAWLHRQGIVATGYVREGRVVEAEVSGLHGWRWSLSRRLESALGEGRRHPGLIHALALGDRQGITPAEWETLLATGTNHLVAISGLHVGLVAGLVYAAVRRVWGLWPGLPLRLASPQAAVLAGAMAAAGYAALAGFAIPTQRALVMLLVGALLVASRRTPDPVRGLALAVWAVLGLDPKAALAPGFWLSFAAVVIILHGLLGRLEPQSGWRSGARLQWRISWGLFPLLLGLFGVASLSSPLANLLMVPLVGLLVVPLVLLGAVLATLATALAAWPLALADSLLAWAWWPLGWLAENEALLFRGAGRPMAVLAMAGVGLFWLFGPRGLPGRRVAPALLLPVLFWSPAQPPPGTAWLTVLDVGDGQAVLVRTRHHALLHGTGPRFGVQFEAGGAIIAPHLQHIGVATLDRLVVASGSNPHHGGLAGLAEEVAILERVGGHDVDSRDAACREVPAWRWDGVDFSLSGAGCHLRVSTGAGRAVVLGAEPTDGDGKAQRHDEGAVRELRIMHGHGASLPAADVVLSREHNPATEAPGEGGNGRLWSTDRHGALHFHITSAGVQWRWGWRSSRSRPWH